MAAGQAPEQAICFLLQLDPGPSFTSDSYLVTGILIVFFVSIIILLLGLWDDIKPLPTSVRLIVQIFASWLVIILSDIYLFDLGNLFGFGDFYLGDLGIPVTIFMVVGVCNAFNMLDGMDGVLESALIGIPHPDFGEGVVAVIVPQSGAKIIQEDIMLKLKDQIARFKHPKRVVFIDELPRNTMGKVQKNDLRKRFARLF